MNVRIRTAHGYLSFQPDGRLEYRAVAGAWENLEIEGLTLERVPVPAPGDPAPVEWGPPPSPTQGYVAAVKAQLEREGVDLANACGAFAITSRVAWGLRRLGYGLLSKPSGNNCQRFATDVIVAPNRHDIVDLLGDGGGDNIPGWLVRINEVDPSRWREPVHP